MVGWVATGESWTWPAPQPFREGTEEHLGCRGAELPGKPAPLLQQ